MKRVCLLAFSVFVLLLCLAGCQKNPYVLVQSKDNVACIRIMNIDVNDDQNNQVLKTLPESEAEAFIQELEAIVFQKYVGDPPRVQGLSVEIQK